MSGRSAIVFGATGATGKHILQELLKSTEYTRVVEAGRSLTKAEAITVGKEKLEQKTVDFEKIGEAGLKEGKFDSVFIALGTTRAAAGSAGAFERIDREYVINAAKAVKSADAAHVQRVVYISSQGASPTSSFLYPKSKGLTEVGIASQGFSETIVCRPGFLANAGRSGGRLAESIFGAVTSVMSHFTANVQIDVRDLAKAAVFAGSNGVAGLPEAANAFKVEENGASFTAVGNGGLIEIAKHYK